MSGNAFKDTSPVSLDELEHAWSLLCADLSVAGLNDITAIGTTWKKPLMGDVDIAASSDVPMGKIVQIMENMFNRENVRRSGGRLVSLRYRLNDGKNIQVDVIVGNVRYLVWSRFGPSTIEQHKDFSMVKGVIRNLYLNTILREMTSTYKGYDRTRVVLDYDVGMNFVEQTKLGVKENVLKEWKTIYSRFITDDPDDITKRIFGTGNAEHSLTFEGCVKLAQASNIDARVRKTFIKELVELSEKNPHVLGESLIDPIVFLKDMK
jgi:hypothetical protein